MPPAPPRPALRRRLGLPLLTLYGIGITIGAGIYVLIGAVAGHAGRAAPWSFVIAGLAMAFTVGSYAELATRYPVSAGEAAYMRAAFNSRVVSTLTGLITILIGVVSSATSPSAGKAARRCRRMISWDSRSAWVLMWAGAFGMGVNAAYSARRYSPAVVTDPSRSLPESGATPLRAAAALSSSSPRIRRAYDAKMVPGSVRLSPRP